MINFENRLHKSAQRLVDEQNKQLKVPNCMYHAKKTYWGWVATPVAAVVGVLFGMCLPFMLEQHESYIAKQMKSQPVPMFLKDTVYLTKTDTQKIVQRDTVYRTRWIERFEDKASFESKENKETECTSVQCDGINYSLLVSN